MFRRRSEKPHVVLLSKPGCHLCEEALVQMNAAGCQNEYSFEEINIENDPVLLKLYGSEIPVVTIDGVKAFKFKLTASDFRRRIKGRKPE